MFGSNGLSLSEVITTVLTPFIYRVNSTFLPFSIVLSVGVFY